MKLITLSNSPLKASISDVDYARVSRYNWGWVKGGPYGKGYARTKIGGRHRFLHRFIFEDDALRDHKNRNGLDCQRSNLRICDKSQNGANRRKQSGRTSSRFKGVYWRPSRRRWVAMIQASYSRRHLGDFKSELEAARAYNRAAKRLFGRFARLNIVPALNPKPTNERHN